MQSATANERTNLSHISSNRQNVHMYLDAIWHQYFPDIPCMNEVQIAYRQPWKSRLGTIRMTVDNKTRSDLKFLAFFERLFSK